MTTKTDDWLLFSRYFSQFCVVPEIYSSLFTENGSNYTVIAKQTAGLNKLNCTIIQPIYNA